MFEYENDLLIVDEMIIDPSLPNAIVVRINNDYYMINNAQCNRPIPENALKPYKKTVNKNWPRAKFNHEFYFAGLMPRGGFLVDIGRPITAEELKELCKKYNLTNNDFTKEFEDISGKLYGVKYAKKYKSIQIKVPFNEAINLETELSEKGIEASNVAPGRVNIRSDWGGYREGAGRKPTGRRLARIYCTEEEEKKLRDFLKELRNE